MAGARAGTGSSVNLLQFYTLERLLFNRMVSQMGKNPGMVKSVITLWLVMEELGYPDLIRLVQAHSNDTIEALFKEGLVCLECIQPDAIEPSESDNIPVLTSLFDEPMNCRFFYHHREFMYKRYMDIMQAVCSKIFGETIALEADASDVQLVVRPFGEEKTTQGAALIVAGGSSSAQAPSQLNKIASEGDPIAQHVAKILEVDHRPIQKTAVHSSLNPEATEFFPEQVPEAARTMFLTFSIGNPLSRNEIIQFFAVKWGIVVQDVFIEKAPRGVPPLFGKVIFTTSLAIPRILDGRTIAKFKVNGKHLWLRSYMPHLRRSRRQQT